MIAIYTERARLLKAVAHPVRLAVLDILRDGEQCVCHIEAMLDLRQAYISQHLMALREAGLVADRREGWNIYYRVTRPEIYTFLGDVGTITGEREEIQHAKRIQPCPCPKCQAA